MVNYCPGNCPSYLLMHFFLGGGGKKCSKERIGTVNAVNCAGLVLSRLAAQKHIRGLLNSR